MRVRRSRGGRSTAQATQPPVERGSNGARAQAHEEHHLGGVREPADQARHLDRVRGHQHEVPIMSAAKIMTKNSTTGWTPSVAETQHAVEAMPKTWPSPQLP